VTSRPAPRSSWRVVEGAAHASSGDYGPQRGDGAPTVDPGTARAEVARTSAAPLDALAQDAVSPGR